MKFFDMRDAQRYQMPTLLFFVIFGLIWPQFWMFIWPISVFTAFTLAYLVPRNPSVLSRAGQLWGLFGPIAIALILYGIALSYFFLRGVAGSGLYVWSGLGTYLSYKMLFAIGSQAKVVKVTPRF